MEYKTITIDQHEDSVEVLVLENRIYLGVTDIFAEEMADVITRDFSEMVIDLSHVSVMNSSGIGVLIKTRDELQKMGRTIKLKNLQPLMKDIFNRMRLDTLFDIETQ